MTDFTTEKDRILRFLVNSEWTVNLNKSYYVVDGEEAGEYDLVYYFGQGAEPVTICENIFNKIISIDLNFEDRSANIFYDKHR